MIHFFGTGPHSRLSALCPRLSPVVKKDPGGVVISFGRLQIAQLASGRMKGSFWSLPSTYTRPASPLILSPGPPTTRLMKLLFDLFDVGFWQGWPSSGSLGMPHVFSSAPAGGLNTTIWPRWGSEKR